MFFASLWTGMWPILGSWLVFKLGFYWQSANFSQFPDAPPKEDDVKYLAAKRRYGSHQVATALVGTGANIVMAFIGVAVARWVLLICG